MTTVTLTRTVPVPPAEAWRAWTDAAELARWWWPQLGDATYDWSPRPGAAYVIASRAAGFGIEGVFTDVEEPHRLAFGWRWVSTGEPDGPEDSVEVTFEPDGDGTLVTVRHASPEDRDAMDGLVQGWEAVLDRYVVLDHVVG
jgi:uncharacterized protein YndB with AHSA1/START domain